MGPNVKISALVFCALFAVSTSANAIPMGPVPIPGKLVA